MIHLIPVSTSTQITHIALLASEIWTEHFTPIIGSSQVEYMLGKIQSEDPIMDQIQNKGYAYFLIERDSQTAGYCAYTLETDRLFLSKLYVLKSMRGKGIARRIVEHFKGVARENGLPKITLTVNKNNTGTIAAYEKLGFVKTGSVVKDIGEGFAMDDYGMELEVT